MGFLHGGALRMKDVLRTHRKLRAAVETLEHMARMLADSQPRSAQTLPRTWSVPAGRPMPGVRELTERTPSVPAYKLPWSASLACTQKLLELRADVLHYRAPIPAFRLSKQTHGWIPRGI